MPTFISFLLSAPEFLGLLPHIFIVSTIILAFLCVKPVRPCGRSSDERRRSFKICFLSLLLSGSGIFYFIFNFFFSMIKIHLRERRFARSGRVWLNGRRSRSLSSSSSSSRAHLEKAELCPRGEDEGMMSCVRPSLPLQPAAPARLSPSRRPTRNSSRRARSSFFTSSFKKQTK